MKRKFDVNPIIFFVFLFFFVESPQWHSSTNLLVLATLLQQHEVKWKTIQTGKLEREGYKSRKIVRRCLPQTALPGAPMLLLLLGLAVQATSQPVQKSSVSKR